MKTIVFSLLFAIMAHLLVAQNVGIGTTNPTARLQVVGQGNSYTTYNLMLKKQSGDTLLRVLDNGAVAIRHNVPASSYDRTLTIGGNGMDFFSTNSFQNSYSGSIYPFPTTTGGNSSLIVYGGDRLLLQSASGTVGVGSGNSPTVCLQVFGAIATTSQLIGFLANNTSLNINVADKSFLVLDNGTAVDKTITLSDGLADGQRLTVMARNTGTGKSIFIDSPSQTNTDISVSGSFVMGDDDTISFIWYKSLGYWIETGRSDN